MRSLPWVQWTRSGSASPLAHISAAWRSSSCLRSDREGGCKRKTENRIKGLLCAHLALVDDELVEVDERDRIEHAREVQIDLAAEVVAQPARGRELLRDLRQDELGEIALAEAGGAR